MSEIKIIIIIIIIIFRQSKFKCHVVHKYQVVVVIGSQINYWSYLYETCHNDLDTENNNVILSLNIKINKRTIKGQGTIRVVFGPLFK